MRASLPSDILVVGAGPVGLTMACELARNGVKCRIIDKMAAPSTTSRALAIFPRTLELFQIMGVVDPVLEAGHQLNGIIVHNRRGEIGHIGFNSIPSRYRFAISLPQSETEGLLIEHLANFGIEVERQKELVDLAQSADAVQTVIRDYAGRDEESSSGWLTGCDGAHSSVRHLLEIPFEGAAYSETFLLSDVRIDGHQDRVHVHLFLTGEGLVGIIPFRGGGCRVIVNTPEEAQTEALGDPCLEEIQTIVDRRTKCGIRLTDPVWLSRFRISHRKIPNFRSGRVFLAGDSAHIHSPAGGQGMNTGIQDAVNLAWKLALVIRQKSPDSLLDSYSEERGPVARMVLSLTDRLTRVATVQGTLGQQLRNTLIPILTGIHTVEDRIADTMAEVGIHYRRSSIVVGKTGHTLHAGDRAPDFEFQPETSGDSFRLFDLFRKPSHHLLLFAGADKEVAWRMSDLGREIDQKFKGLVDAFLVIRSAHTDSPNVLIDWDSGAHALYEAEPGAIILVRPDGYIGFRGGTRHVEALLEHLGRIFSV
jgi:2-polyprenyl-6-methoxyphenol hydroxylase-like FAD-dependent oxidoreductase